MTRLDKAASFAATEPDPETQEGRAPMSEWMPISTAPKDGTEVLCLADQYDGPVMLRWYAYNGLAAWRDWDQDIYAPTHWFDLPAPPTPEARS